MERSGHCFHEGFAEGFVAFLLATDAVELTKIFDTNGDISHGFKLKAKI